MTAAPHDSAIYRKLFTEPDVARLFTDTAELRAILLTWGALAKAQATHDLIPQTAAEAIQRAAMEIQIDPAAVSEATATNGVPIPGLVALFREEMKAPEHAAYLHFGATSQDILDTALSLRLRQALTLIETGLHRHLAALAKLASDHAEKPMAARTWGQVATPTSFGAVAASWGHPVLSLLTELDALRATALPVSLTGAAGTASALGPKAAQIRATLADGLGLPDPGRSWHADRTPRTTLAAWLNRLAQALGRFGSDLDRLTSSGRGEVRLALAGGSSTMPQKQNPVQPAILRALALHSNGLNTTLQAAANHTEQRDGGAWMAEWLTLPQLVIGTAAGVTHAATLAETIHPVPMAMAQGLALGGGTAFAEGLMFTLARTMPRPEAQAVVKALCQDIAQTGESLEDAALRRFADHDLTAAFQPNLGSATDEARAFAAAVEALPSPSGNN